MYQNDALKVLTGECRLSYCHLSQPWASQPGAEAKYGITLLIPKTDYATKADIDQAIQAAINEGVAKCWNGARPPMMQVPVYDGDGVRRNGEAFSEECRSHWVLTASSKQKPQVVDISNINCELSPNDVYSGMYGRVTVRFFAFNSNGNRGVGCGLGNVLKTRDGEALSGHTTAANDFAGLGQSIPVYPQTAPAYHAQPYPQQTPTYPAPVVNPITGLPVQNYVLGL